MKKVLLVFILIISCLHCEAQNKSFKLKGFTSIEKKGTEIYHLSEQEIEFELDDKALIIRFTIGPFHNGKIEISRNKIKTGCILPNDESDYLKFAIFDDTYKKGIIYFKRIDCSSNSPSQSGLKIQVNDDEQYVWPNGVMFYNPGDYNLYEQSIEEDAFIKFIIYLEAISTKESLISTPDYGEIKFSGYTYEWSDYYRSSHENDNSSLTVETQPSHYIAVKHGVNVTNLSPNRSGVKWSTCNGAIKVSLPEGVSISDNDEIICWENGSSTDADYRSVVLFIWNSSSKKLQCLRTVRRHWDGRTLNDVFYFRTTDASAWSKIKPKLLHELPFCGTQVR